MEYPGGVRLSYKLMLGAAAVMLAYVGLVLVLPRVLDDHDRLLFNSRLGRIEQSLAVLMDRDGDGRESSRRRPAEVELVSPIPAATRAALRPEGGEPDSAAILERLERVVAALEKLERSVRAQSTLPRAGVGPPSLRAVLDAKREMDEQALDVVAAEWRLDEETTRRSLELLTRVEVLARFGPPTLIQTESWIYEFGEGGQRCRMQLRFHDGYVSGAWVKLDL